MPAFQSKRWCFTWNNYDEESINTLHTFNAVHCNYLVYGKEVAPTTKTPHLQGFCTLKKKMSLTAIKNALSKSPHFEAAKGTSQQASEYCKKENDFNEFGDVPFSGRRTDLTEACEMIKNGQSMIEVANLNPETFVKFGRGLRDLALTIQKPYAHDSVRGIWIYGPPGSGKSHMARNLYPEAFLKSQSKWFDGYAMETAIILDDLDSNVLGHHLKIWSDKYACTGETKGGTVALQHKVFIVTSNYHPSDLWPDDAIMTSAICRRFDIVHKRDRSVGMKITKPEPVRLVRQDGPSAFTTYCKTGKIISPDKP